VTASRGISGPTGFEDDVADLFKLQDEVVCASLARFAFGGDDGDLPFVQALDGLPSPWRRLI
jgi:hypothetical protein